MKTRFFFLSKVVVLVALFMVACGKDDDLDNSDFITAYQGKQYQGPVTAVYDVPGESHPMSFSGRATFTLKDIQNDDVTLSLAHNITGLEAFNLDMPGRQQGRSWVLQLIGVQGTLMIDEKGEISGTAGDSHLQHHWVGNLNRDELELEITINYLQEYNDLPKGTVVQIQYVLKR